MKYSGPSRTRFATNTEATSLVISSSNTEATSGITGLWQGVIGVITRIQLQLLYHLRIDFGSLSFQNGRQRGRFMQHQQCIPHLLHFGFPTLLFT